MKRIATIACLIVLTAGPASVWADAFGDVPPQHQDIALQASDGCLAPVCCQLSVPVPARRACQERLATTVGMQAPAEIALVAANVWTIVDPLAGDPSPARSQTSPVLLS